VLLVVTASTIIVAFQRAEPHSIAFVHVAVIDATGAPVKPDQTVLISGDRITAVAFKLTEHGTIEKGMRADLVLLDASPLDQIEKARKIRAVVARRRVFERNELDAMLADIQRPRANGPERQLVNGNNESNIELTLKVD
jgi:hypothetical protein